MNILVLNRSPHPDGNIKTDDRSFQRRRRRSRQHGNGCRCLQEKMAGCLSCEYCHKVNPGICVQKDDMQEIHTLLRGSDMLVITSPIYYHNLSGQLKCAIDRLYAAVLLEKPERLKKAAMILSSGDSDIYRGALYFCRGNFLEFFVVMGMVF